jgi:site-specific recombinase XerD
MVAPRVPIEIIKDFMGHRNISTTMIYTKVKTDTLKKAELGFDQKRD